MLPFENYQLVTIAFGPKLHQLKKSGRSVCIYAHMRKVHDLFLILRFALFSRRVICGYMWPVPTRGIFRAPGFLVGRNKHPCGQHCSTHLPLWSWKTPKKQTWLEITSSRNHQNTVHLMNIPFISWSSWGGRCFVPWSCYPLSPRMGHTCPQPLLFIP